MEVEPLKGRRRPNAEQRRAVEEVLERVTEILEEFDEPFCSLLAELGDAYGHLSGASTPQEITTWHRQMTWLRRRAHDLVNFKNRELMHYEQLVFKNRFWIVRHARVPSKRVLSSYDAIPPDIVDVSNKALCDFY